MNRSSMSGLLRDFTSGESVAATSAEGVKRRVPWSHEKMTARAAGAMVRRSRAADVANRVERHERGRQAAE
jgi:hypothetical protein